MTAPSLASGVTWVEQPLGVPKEPGGEHPLMGTHDRLLRLADDIYLEVITANPQAATPGRPRWFELDALAPGDAPRLRNWVARTNDIAVVLKAAGEDLGTITEQRHSGRRWLMTIPGDGKPLMGGAAPALLDATGIDDPVLVRHPPEGEGSSLVGHIATPSGLRSLSIAA